VLAALLIVAETTLQDTLITSYEAQQLVEQLHVTSIQQVGTAGHWRQVVPALTIDTSVI